MAKGTILARERNVCVPYSMKSCLVSSAALARPILRALLFRQSPWSALVRDVAFRPEIPTGEIPVRFPAWRGRRRWIRAESGRAGASGGVPAERRDVSRVCPGAVRSGVQARPGAPPRGGDRPDGPATARAAAACPWVRAGWRVRQSGTGRSCRHCRVPSRRHPVRPLAPARRRTPCGRRPRSGPWGRRASPSWRARCSGAAFRARSRSRSDGPGSPACRGPVPCPPSGPGGARDRHGAAAVHGKVGDPGEPLPFPPAPVGRAVRAAVAPRDAFPPGDRLPVSGDAGPDVGMGGAGRRAVRWRSSCRVPSAPVNRAARVSGLAAGLANGSAWSPGLPPGTERRPCRRRRAMWGPLDAGPSCGTMAFRRRCPRRRSSTDRAAALRWRSFLLSPSVLAVGSGAGGGTSRRSGWRTTAAGMPWEWPFDPSLRLARRQWWRWTDSGPNGRCR